MISIVYQDIALKARKNSNFVANLNQSFAKINDLVAPFEIKKYGTFENESYPLDGSFANFPDDVENYKWGYFGSELSQIDGALPTPITLTATISGGYYSSTGISFKFDTTLNNYPTELKIRWYKDNNIITSATFKPDNSIYFCENNVNLFNKVEVVFTKMNKWDIYLKITDFEFGTLRTFREDEITDIDIDVSIAPISEELSINTLNFGLENKQNIKFNFQNRQAMKVFSDADLLGTFYITKSKQKSLRQFNINCEDISGALDSMYYYGGIYNNITVKNLVAEIMQNTGIEYILDDELKPILLNGYLPILSIREALTQISFAIGATIITAYSDKLNIFVIKPSLKSIEKSQIFYGGDIETKKEITETQLTEHSYIESTEEVEVFKGVLTVGTHEIHFNEPLHGLTITNATIVSQGSNYAIINISTQGEVILKGKKYIHTTKILNKKNPNIIANTPKNVIKVEKNTLITSSNSAKILDILYNEYVGNRVLTQEIVVDNERLGDKAVTFAEFGNKKAGLIKSMEINGKGALTARIEIDIEYDIEDAATYCGELICGEEFVL